MLQFLLAALPEGHTLPVEIGLQPWCNPWLVVGEHLHILRLQDSVHSEGDVGRNHVHSLIQRLSILQHIPICAVKAAPEDF